MAKPKTETQTGYKIIATVKSVKGNCSWGHEEGDSFEISCHNTAGLCGFFYHDIYPQLMMLQFGGSFPATWGNQDVVNVECMDKYNLVKMELKRVKA
ncbi:MAG: TIGR04076 family protein [Deltaproteobacteria bacterium]|nr:TIGR04076 family protein [Deltaproteobacteria bacterium]